MVARSPPRRSTLTRAATCGSRRTKPAANVRTWCNMGTRVSGRPFKFFKLQSCVLTIPCVIQMKVAQLFVSHTPFSCRYVSFHILELSRSWLNVVLHNAVGDKKFSGLQPSLVVAEMFL